MLGQPAEQQVGGLLDGGVDVDVGEAADHFQDVDPPPRQHRGDLSQDPRSLQEFRGTQPHLGDFGAEGGVVPRGPADTIGAVDGGATIFKYSPQRRGSSCWTKVLAKSS